MKKDEPPEFGRSCKIHGLACWNHWVPVSIHEPFAPNLVTPWWENALTSVVLKWG